MSTNYYHRTNICECCGRYDERHIGKNLTNFQGYTANQWDKDSVNILSWADWKSVILAGGEVWNEYGYKENTDQFIKDVESTLIDNRRRQYDWVANNLPYQLGNYWLDDDQFSFTTLDFT